MKVTAFLKNKIFKNFANLSFLNIATIFLGFLTYPYLIRVLGKETFGLVVFVQTIIQYFNVFISYGYNISATQEIAININNDKKVSEIISSTFISKLFLFIVTILILLFLIITIPIFKENQNLFLCSFFLCVQEVVFPIWYFLGAEKMKLITKINIISRLIFAMLVFLVIKEESDYLLVPILSGLGALVGGFYSLILIYYKTDIVFINQPIKQLVLNFKTSTYFFISNISNILYSNSGKLILGFTGNMQEVAFYDLGQRILDVLKSLLSTLEQAVFPELSRSKNVSLFKKIFKISFSAILLITIAVFLLSKYFIYFLAGEDMLLAVNSFRILIISIIPISFKLFYGHILLLILNKKGEFLKLNLVFLFTYIFQIAICYRFYEINALTISVIYLSNELLVAVASYIISKKYLK